MKKRFILFLTLLLCLPTFVQAQANQATAIELIAVDLWPDYDQASVLVLITGAFPADTNLPATVTIPLPADASLNAVARISAENSMIDDIQFTQNADSVTLTTPDIRFRIEYYMPYQASNNDRTFTFTWMADVAVEQFEVSIQQPAAASSMNVIPAPANTTAGSVDNLTYHILPVTSIAANESYEVTATYTMAVPQLSVDLAVQQQAATPQTAVSPPPITGNNTNLPLILGIVGGVLIVAVLAWALVNNQKTTPRPRKPTPRRKTAVKSSPPPARLAPAAQAVKFCHECGEGIQAGDKFCRECGTAVKNT